jgi:uncharacterized protein YjdB
MNSKGDTDRKIWATEAGWATGTGSGEVSEADQAAFTSQLFDLWFSLPYAGPLIWYELIDNSSYDNNNRENTFGLLHSSQPWTEKPAYQSFVSKIVKEEVPVTGISVNALSLELKAGAAGIQLAAAVSPVNASNQEVIWSSSNPQVASVADDGFVTPLVSGKATITATASDGGLQASVTIKVKH